MEEIIKKLEKLEKEGFQNTKAFKLLNKLLKDKYHIDYFEYKYFGK